MSEAEERARLHAELAEARAFGARLARAAGHELRSPLNKIQAFADLLRDGLGPRLSGADAENLDFLGRCVAEMRERVDRLHAWGRLSLEREALSDVDLESCVDAALATERAAGATVERAPLPVVRGSRPMLTQLFGELLENAFTFCEGAPRVAVTRAADDVFGVRDAGIGIPAEHRARALEPFERLQSPRRYPGTGMGLAIAARIAAEHGGRLWIEAGDDGGTHVRFTLGGNDAR